MKPWPLYLALIAVAFGAGAAPRAKTAAKGLPGYVDSLPPETPEERAARRQRVAARRAQEAVIIVHRGAAAFAPENTLEAYAAAMDYGADGCEIDLRRTADGVLVLFHDDMLDQLTDGFGTVSQATYSELLSLRPRFRYGRATPDTRPPTFAAALALARQRAMLLHLDVKQSGLDRQISDMLTAADMWDHVTAVNGSTAPILARDPRVKPLKFKGPGLYAKRHDVDPTAVRAQLALPGQAIMVDDPRVAARELKRKPYTPVALPRGLRRPWTKVPALTTLETEPLLPMAHLQTTARRARAEADLLRILRGPDERTRTTLDGSPDYLRRRLEGILERVWAAQQLAQRGKKSRAIVAALEYQVEHRTLHRDWMYHGLDGALAARALGMLKATEAAPVLIRAFRRIDPALEKVRNPEFGPHPLAWTDFRIKMSLLPALGELRCPASKSFLQEYLTMDDAAARELAPVQIEAATQALLKQNLSRQELETLLQSGNSAIRGTAILECLDRPTPVRTAAIRAVAPWATTLPTESR